MPINPQVVSRVLMLAMMKRLCLVILSRAPLIMQNTVGHRRDPWSTNGKRRARPYQRPSPQEILPPFLSLAKGGVDYGLPTETLKARIDRPYAVQPSRTLIETAKGSISIVDPHFWAILFSDQEHKILLVTKKVMTFRRAEAEPNLLCSKNYMSRLRFGLHQNTSAPAMSEMLL